MKNKIILLAAMMLAAGMANAQQANMTNYPSRNVAAGQISGIITNPISSTFISGTGLFISPGPVRLYNTVNISSTTDTGGIVFNPRDNGAANSSIYSNRGNFNINGITNLNLQGFGNTRIRVTSAGVFIGAGSTPATGVMMQVSGTSILGNCNTSVTCGSTAAGAMCYRTTNNTYYYCDGANSWTPLTVGAKVSASTLN